MRHQRTHRRSARQNHRIHVVPVQKPAKCRRCTHMRSDVSGGSVLNNVAAPQVHIDKMTTVPADLYKKMVVAGSRARARGQHSLKAKPRSNDAKYPSRSFEPSLVRNKSYYG
ncbi:unnamed protein product [Effrenium voratum]|uniref:Uncharacterized protein n=1 Tax=Effrenium voratum TaxID=2562239 RepID=A0AA36JFM7_9DINO|nr:unnamed protein product [Effrenium voratum]